MSSSKSRKRRSDSSSSSSSSSESDSSASSRDCKKRKHSETSSDSENDKKSKVRKEHKTNPEDKHESKQERSDKYKRNHKDYKAIDNKKSHRENDRNSNRKRDNDKYRRSHDHEERRRNDNRSDDHEERHRNDNRIDDHRRKDTRRERSGRKDWNRERNDSGSRRKSPGRFRGNRNNRSRSKSFDHANAKWGKESKEAPTGEKQKANFGLSGKLTEETNTYKGVVIKYSEPPEARKPKRRWRLYPFKGEKALQTLYIHRESAYLIGRDRKVVDLPVDHPSCSKQHAALQYRLVPFTRDDGSAGKRVRPYIIDLESANGTFINNKKIDPKKYVELLEKDVIKFGFSSREYVLLHENSKDDAQDDDVKLEEEEVKVKKEEQDTAE